ncbi:glycosyltransferase [Lysinibacillus capsici]|uniref:glycosyltransferase n=1 Tax=Lysinibacillus capsici TaxID=2115968 RepID=UPI0034E49AFF
MNLAFAINKKYILHFVVTLKSIENNFNNDTICIYILSLDLTENDFLSVKGQFPRFKFIWKNLKGHDFKDFFVNAHISYETYFRILIPEVINEEKVLYLDSDLIVRKSLEELYNKNLDSFAVAAAYDYKAQGRKEELGIPEGYDYFNAGVLLMNLKYWRSNNLTYELIKYVKDMKEKLTYWDQDALNAQLYDKVLMLEDTWNIQTASFESNNIDKSALVNPAIVHFTGASKPWHVSSNSLFQQEYLKYMYETRCEGFKFISDNVKGILKIKKDIYIWGAGLTGEKVYKYLGINIKGFIDSDKEKSGKEFCGKPIYLIQEIKKNEDIGILVCSGYYEEISNSLKNHGYQENKDFAHQM